MTDKALKIITEAYKTIFHGNKKKETGKDEIQSGNKANYEAGKEL